MKLRRLSCLLLVLLLISCVAYSSLPCGYVSAAETVDYNGLSLPDIDSVGVDRSVYPYAFIIAYGSSEYVLYFIDTVPVVNGSLRASATSKFVQYRVKKSSLTSGWGSKYSKTVSKDTSLSADPVLWTDTDIYDINGNLVYGSPSSSSCPNTDADCNNICDDCGELLPMEYWSTYLEYLVTAGYNIVDHTASDYFCILYNEKEHPPADLIVGETEFEINTYGDVLLTKNPTLYKLSMAEDGSFSHYVYEDVSCTSDGVYLDPEQYLHNNSIRVLYSNHNINNRFVYNPDYDPFGGGTTVGGGSDRDQAQRFDIDIDTYEPIGGLPADPDYGSGRVDVVVSPSAPPVSVPISPTSPVPTPDPSDPVVSPSPDPSEPNSIIIQNQITNIGENIAALPEKLGDKIAGAIKGLFVPSENDFIAIRLKWNLLLEERFGAVYESTAIIDSIVDTFQYSGDMSSIKFPSVTVDLAGTPFTFGGWDVEVIPEGLKFLVSSVKLIVSIVCTVLFVNAMRKKLEGLINR